MCVFVTTYCVCTSENPTQRLALVDNKTLSLFHGSDNNMKRRASLGDDIVFSHVVISWKVQVYVWIMENFFFCNSKMGINVIIKC